MLGVSIDSIFSHKVYSLSLGNLWFPLLADFHPKGAVAELYGVMSDQGYARRASFIIDTGGIVRHKEVYERGLPDIDQLIQRLKAL